MTTGSSFPQNYYQQNPHRPLLGHISLGVKSYAASKPFYTALLAPFHISLIYDDAVRKILGYGNPGTNAEIVNIFEKGDDARSPGAGFHIAFNAPSRDAVAEWYQAGIANGGTGVGEPGIRSQYGRNYYAAFLLDLDGYKLEAVFQDEVVGERERVGNENAGVLD